MNLSQPGVVDREPSAEPAARRRKILEHLDQVLQYSSFRTSLRSQEFLRYVVVHALDGMGERLKERMIGAELFGRTVDYDTSEDAVVRVKANEVRKRLAQYYLDSGARSNIRIVLPTGSYVPEFILPSPEPVAAPASVVNEPKPAKARWRWLAGLLMTGVAVGVAGLRWSATPDVLTQFWEPALSSSRPVLIGIGGNSDLYSLRRDPARRNPFETPALSSILRDELVSVRGQYVGAGGAQAVFRLAMFFSRQGKDAFLRTGPNLNFHEMKDHPSVVIGAYSSALTWATVRNLRFYFDDPQNGHRIRDREDPQQSWAPELDGQDRLQVDYALISRVLHSETGQFLIVASGLTGEGCIAAADFVTRPETLSAVIREAPGDWRRMNFQAIVRTRMIGNTASAPEVVRHHFWRP